MAQYGEKLAEWQFPEFTREDRGQFWYTVAMAAAVLFLLYALFTANFLFAVIILLAGVVFYLRRHEQPEMIAVAFYENGLRLADKFYDWDELRDFYIIYEPPEVTDLYVHTGGILHARLKIDLADQDPIAIRSILLDYLDEDLDKTDEPLSSVLERVFKI